MYVKKDQQQSLSLCSFRPLCKGVVGMNRSYENDKRNSKNGIQLWGHNHLSVYFNRWFKNLLKR